MDCPFNPLISWTIKVNDHHYNRLVVYPLCLSLLPFFLCLSLIPLSWSGCTCLHTTLHTALMGVNCNWICCCLCQQFPFGSVSVAVITPCVKRHATVNTSPCYCSLSSFFLFGGDVVTSQWRGWLTVSTVNVDINIVQHVLLVQPALCLLLSKGGLLKFIPFSLCQVVFLTFLSGRHCSPRTLFVRPKQWFPSTRLWESMPKLDTSIQKDGTFAKSFNRSTT